MKRTRWVPLADAVTVAQAQEQLKTLHVDRARNELPMLKRTPKFADYAAQYLAYYDTMKDAKGPATLQKERGPLTFVPARNAASATNMPRPSGNPCGLARKAAGLDRFGFHDCQHFFIS